MSISSKLVYALAFQAGWFICIMAGSLASIFYTALFVTYHFVVLKHKKTNQLLTKEAFWIVLVSLIGLGIETIHFSAGFLYTHFPKQLFNQLLLPPVWLLCLWVIFSLALRSCLSFIFYKPALSYLTCFIVVPLNYYAGARLNSEVELNEPYILSLALITLIWIVFLWCLTHIKRRYFEDIFNAD